MQYPDTTLKVLKIKYSNHKNLLEIHGIKLIGHNEVITLTKQRLKNYIDRMTKHISYLRTTNDDLTSHFATKVMDLEHFNNYRIMLGYLLSAGE